MAVMDAVYTIMCAGYDMITDAWVARVMSGNPKLRASDRHLAAIRQSVDKLCSISINIDCTDEFSHRRDTPKGGVTQFTSYLLDVDKQAARYQVNGKEAVAYHLLTCPALYRYAEAVKQIISVPAELLDTHDRYYDTDEAMLIKRYVVRRVAQIVTKNELRSNKVSFYWYDRSVGAYKGLLQDLGYKPDITKNWRHKKQRINKVVKLTLQSLADKSYITGYETYRADGTTNPASPITGYKIFFNKDVVRILSNMW
jgi:hypothetical protein